MGSMTSKEVQFGVRHPARFYKACAAVEQGAYTNSEIYFNQAMTSHPGHAFWTRLMDVVIAKQSAEKEPEAAAAGSPSASAMTPTADTRRSRSPSPRAQPPLSPTGQQSPDDVFCGGDTAREGECGVANSRQATPPPQSPPAATTTGEDANTSLKGSAAESDSKPILVLPVDHRLVDVQDYVRMLTDISRIYRRKAGDSTGDSREMSCRLSMLYNAYTAVRLEAMLTVFRGHFSTPTTEGDMSEADVFQIYSQCSMNAQWGNSAFKAEIDHAGSMMGGSAVSFRSMDKQRGEADHLHDSDVCIFWQYMMYLVNTNRICYVTSALGLLQSEDYTMSPGTQKAVVEMALRCLEVVEQGLARTADANSHMYVGSLMKKFSAVLAHYREECHHNEAAATKFGIQRRGHGMHGLRTMKELEPKFLRLDAPNLATRQQTFLRTAMSFPVMTLPLLDESKVMQVELKLESKRVRHHPGKLLTPLHRSYGWYFATAEYRTFERHSEKPGGSPFLLQKCGVPPMATLKDASLFSCVGLEEFSIIFLLLGVARGGILNGMGKTKERNDLGKATLQLSTDLFGGPTRVSGAVEFLFGEMDPDTKKKPG